MTRALAASLALLCAPGAQRPAPVAAPARAATPASPSRIEGVVKDPAGKPLEKALVMARATDARPHERTHATRTDAAGRFTLEVGRRAVYFLRAESPGLAPHIVERLPLPAAPLAITLRKGVAIEGVVRDARGRPLAGARVETRDRMRTGTALLFPEAGLVQATSDARGAFRLDGLRTGSHYLTASAPGVGGGSRTAVAPATKLDLFLAPGGSLRGTVRGPDGKPLSAAAVSVASELGVFGGTATVRRTSEAGTFEAWGLPAGAYVVLVHQPGSGTAVRRVVLARNAEERVDVTLEPASRLRGRLVDEEQRPVRAAVALQEIEGQNVVATLGQVVTTEADAEGRFLLAEVPRAAVSLAVTSQGYAPKRVEATVARPDMDLGDVVVERGLAIRGVVRDAQGRPVPHADLRAHGEGPGTARGALEGHAGEDGTFLLPGAQPGLYRVRATADGYTVATERASAGGDPVVLVLERGGSLTGTVVDEKGVPVPVFRVAAEPAAEPESGRGVYAEGGDGRLELADLAAGEWLLVVTARDKEAARLTGVLVRAGGTTDVGRITLSSGMTLRGRVSDGAGAPVAGASVWWEVPAADGPGTGGEPVLTDAAGAFEMSGLGAGTVDVVADHPEYAQGRLAGVAVDPEAREGEVRVVLARGGRVEGTVRRRDGRPPAGAHVRVASLAAARLRSRTGAVAPDGTYSVEHVPAGRLRVMLMANTGSESVGTAQQREVAVAEGETAVVDFLLRDIFVSGTVTRRGEPAAGVRLQLRHEGAHMMMSLGPSSGTVPQAGPQRGWAITRADGRYDLMVDEPGRYWMTLSSSDGRVTYPGRQVIVPDADGFTADFAFAGVAVSGQVVDEAGTPVAGQVTANRLATEGSGRTTAMVGRDGRFTLELEPGEYMIGPHAEGYVGTGTRVTIGEGDLDNVRLLVTRGGEISGRVVDAQGRGAGGIQVHAFPDDGPPRPGGPGTFGSARALLDGRFTITGLSDRRYVLTAGDAESGFGAAPDVAVGTRDALLRLAPGGRVRARVVASDGSPAPLAMAFVRQVDGRPFFGGRPEQTDAQGMAELAVPAGTIVVSAGNASGTGSATVAVTAGETAVVEIRLEGRPPGRGTR